LIYIGVIYQTLKMCKTEGCAVRACFNLEGEKFALFCGTHKKEGMINVVSKTCAEEGCTVVPNFNIERAKTGLYCASHKKEGMVDVKHKTCAEEGCTVRPAFNAEGQKNALYCASHKKDGMVNVVSKTCLSEWCFTVVQEKYDGYCLFCYMHLFPDKPVARNYKTKEFAVVDFVKTTFSHFDWVADKIVQGGCSRKRPDLLLDLGYQIVIVEVDENQHVGYDCSCENKRIMELSQDLGHRPIVFIRFNPDEYENETNKMVTSCWGVDKKGICVVKKSKADEWASRLSALADQIMYWSHPVQRTTKTVEIVQLFYDYDL
jgi:hypothetical protein